MAYPSLDSNYTASVLTYTESYSLFPHNPKATEATLKYTNDLFSNAITYIIDKVAAAFRRFIEFFVGVETPTPMHTATTLLPPADVSDLSSTQETPTPMHTATTLLPPTDVSDLSSTQETPTPMHTATTLLPPTDVSDLSFTQNGTRSLEASIEAGKTQLRVEAPRPGTDQNTTRYIMNGERVTPENVDQIISRIETTTPNEIDRLRILSMFHQGLYADSSTSLLNHLNDSTNNSPKEAVRSEAVRSFELATGADIRLSVKNKEYLFKTTSHTTTILNTETQTITGHRLITPMTSPSIEEYLNATSLPGFPDRPYYIQTTYDYRNSTLKIEKMDPAHFPSSS